MFVWIRLKIEKSFKIAKFWTGSSASFILLATFFSKWKLYRIVFFFAESLSLHRLLIYIFHLSRATAALQNIFHMTNLCNLLAHGNELSWECRELFLFQRHKLADSILMIHFPSILRKSRKHLIAVRWSSHTLAFAKRLSGTAIESKADPTVCYVSNWSCTSESGEIKILWAHG